MSRIGPGERVADRYAVLEELGGGGMGVVYLAHDEKEGRDVALKVLREAPPAEAARRMRREARAARALDAARVAPVHEIGESPDGELYLVMEYVPGETVRAALLKGRTFERAEVLRIIREVAVTLGQAHRAGMIHRDVKPDNVMLADRGRVVLLDFGIVKQIDAGGDAAHLSTQLTLEGVAVGTPAYLAPEQALGGKVEPAADQFALAVMTYELLAGKLPWSATDVTKILAQILSDTPAPPSAHDGRLPGDFDGVLARALAKQPEARYPTIEAFADALVAANGGVIAPSPESITLGNAVTSRPPAGRGRRAAGVAALIAVAIAAGSALVLRAWHDGAGAAGGAAALASLGGPDAKLACPLFETRRGPPRIGAAAASLTCVRAKWYFGGRDDRVLPPAALLHLPAQPTADGADPYASDDARAKTADVARSVAAVYVAGVVDHDADGWRVSLSLRDPGAREIVRGEGRDGDELALAVKRALESMWKAPPMTTRPLDPELARWSSIPDAEVGLDSADLEELASPGVACAALESRAPALGNVFFAVAARCLTKGRDAGVPVLDESSAPALLASAKALVAVGSPALVPAEAARLAARLDSFRVAEKLPLARSLLAETAGALWSLAGSPDLAHAAFLAAVREDPLSLDAWKGLVATAADADAALAATRAASNWWPSIAAFDRGGQGGDRSDRAGGLH